MCPPGGFVSASSFPVQYSTTYFVAYGFAHAIWIASISCGEREIDDHPLRVARNPARP